MKKEITKEKVIETALELMRDGSKPEGKNLRSVARALNCAHTNLYNYFPSYNDLLWEAHITVMDLFLQELFKKTETNDPEQRLYGFFGFFSDFYLNNKGWFRLTWQEQIGGERPQRHVEAINRTNDALNNHLFGIARDLTGKAPDRGKLKCILHNIHCYIIGEVSNYILGRGIIEEEAELKTYVTREAVRMFRYYLAGVL